MLISVMAASLMRRTSTGGKGHSSRNHRLQLSRPRIMRLPEKEKRRGSGRRSIRGRKAMRSRAVCLGCVMQTVIEIGLVRVLTSCG
jgi:hypothetical protein